MVMYKEGFTKSGLKLGVALGQGFIYRVIQNEGFTKSGLKTGVVSHLGGVSSGVPPYSLRRFSVRIASIGCFRLAVPESCLAEGSMIPACPSLMCFFNGGNIEGTISSKILYLNLFVYVKFYICVRTTSVDFNKFCDVMLCMHDE